MKRDVRLFVSYAQRNAKPTRELMDQLTEHFNISKRFKYSVWQDEKLLPGQNFEEKIMEHIDQCDASILMISPSFLGSDFIINKELPRLIGANKLLFPVAIHSIDFERHDLQGLNEKQIFFLRRKKFTAARSYSELGSARKDEFALELFRQIDDRLYQELK